MPAVDARRDQDNLFESVGLSPLAMVLSNPRRPDNPLELVNSAFCRLTGYAEGDIVGRNCRFLAGGSTEPAATEQIRAAIRTRRPALVDILNYRSDGTAFRNGVMITPIYGPEGELAWFLGSQVDLGPAHGEALAERRSRAAERVAALPPRQREVLAAMARGLLNKQIAWELKIAEKTVKMHRSLLIERLGVRTSAEAIRIAVEAGL
ncbi:MAG TPA: LuxR C-terminal-related transcriptional regulator [Sphingomicrobium sp.]|nr:LuxR C-terminal-related transcriptional regulator [Sphingomicrobium sp.]